MDENKKRALAAALGQIEKQFGKGSVMRMGERTVEAVRLLEQSVKLEGEADAAYEPWLLLGRCRLANPA